jgi:hypothetical protein
MDQILLIWFLKLDRWVLILLVCIGGKNLILCLLSICSLCRAAWRIAFKFIMNCLGLFMKDHVLADLEIVSGWLRITFDANCMYSFDWNFWKCRSSICSKLLAFKFPWILAQFHSLLFLPGRYNLMANRVLLLLAMGSRNVPNISSKILSETAGEYLPCQFVWLTPCPFHHHSFHNLMILSFTISSTLSY